MTEFESDLRAAAVWPAAGLQPEWEDVLRRAGLHRSRALGIGARQAAVAAGVGIVAVVLTVPALGIGERLKDLVTGKTRPGLRLAATLHRPDGSDAGTLSVRTSRLFVTVGRHGRSVAHPFSARGQGVPKGIEATWRLDLAGSDQARSVRIVRTGAVAGRRLVAVVCDPCSERTTGRLRLTRAGFSSLLRGRTSASVSTARGRVTGRIEFEPPPRG
jgi:hypothetical protein